MSEIGLLPGELSLAIFDESKHRRDLKGRFRDSPGRGPTGKIRNFKAMGKPKLANVITKLEVFGEDPLALEEAKAAQKDAPLVKEIGPLPGEPDTTKPGWKWSKDEQLTRYDMTFSSFGDAVPGGYNGGYVAYSPEGERLGVISYQSATGDPMATIDMVEVEPEHRNKGVATKLLDWMRRYDPEMGFQHGMTTEEGTAWQEALPVELRGDILPLSKVDASGPQPVGQLQPGTFIKTKRGNNFQIAKHGKWTTVYPVDEQGVRGPRHTVLQPDTEVEIVDLDAPKPEPVEQIPAKLATEEDRKKTYTGLMEIDPSANLAYAKRILQNLPLSGAARFPNGAVVTKAREYKKSMAGGWTNGKEGWSIHNPNVPYSMKAKEGIVKEVAKAVKHAQLERPNTHPDADALVRNRFDLGIQWSQLRERDTGYDYPKGPDAENHLEVLRQQGQEDQMAVRLHTKALAGFLADGRLKSQHITQTSGGMIVDRHGLEESIWNIGAESPLEAYPIYGYLADRQERGVGSEYDEMLAFYGDVKLHLRDELKERATVFQGDTLMEGDTVQPSPLLNPRIESTSGWGADERYAETQIFGAVVPADVERITFGSNRPSPEVQATLKRMGIPWSMDQDAKIGRGGGFTHEELLKMSIDNEAYALALAQERRRHGVRG